MTGSKHEGVQHEVSVRETYEIWNSNADWWADRIGEGNRFQLEILNPPTERLLDLRPGERVLDIACGNGPFSRRMARAGAEVVAFDFSERFIERARERSAETGDAITYHVLDATDEASLLGRLGGLPLLGEGSFDAAVCNMGLMDIVEIAPLLSALSHLLRPGGRFVYAIPHPCFHSTATSIVGEQIDDHGELVTQWAVKVRDYLGLKAQRGIGIIGQPQPHWYFDRPLGAVFGECFRNGFALDGFEELPSPPGGEPARPFSFETVPGIPIALVARMRLVTPPHS